MGLVLSEQNAKGWRGRGMTEQRIQLSITDLIDAAEPVSLADLSEGSPLEILRTGKDLQSILHFTVGATSDDPEVAKALESVHTHALALSAKINAVSFSGFKSLECGLEIREAFEALLIQLEYLLDLLDPECIPQVERAFVTS